MRYFEYRNKDDYDENYKEVCQIYGKSKVKVFIVRNYSEWIKSLNYDNLIPYFVLEDYFKSDFDYDTELKEIKSVKDARDFIYSRDGSDFNVVMAVPISEISFDIDKLQEIREELSKIKI